MRILKQKAAIIGGARIPFTKSFGHYSKTSNADLLTAAIIET